MKTKNFTQPITSLVGVGPTTAAKLERLGIRRLNELITYWPRTWLDLMHPAGLENRFVKGDKVVVEVCLERINYQPKIKSRMARVEAVGYDDNGREIDIAWFNQGYLSRVLRPNKKLILYGAISWNWQKKKVYLVNPKRFERPEILPIYNLTKGLSTSQLNRLINRLVKSSQLPRLSQPGFIDFDQAIKEIHCPSSIEMLNKAKKRIAQDEWNLLQHKLLQVKSADGSGVSSIKPNIKLVRKYVKLLPFQLDPQQKKAAWELMGSIAEEEGSQVLLQGEVGSGKTIVASLVLISCLSRGSEVAWLAPTKVLARQLAGRLSSLMQKVGFEVKLVLSGFQEDFRPGVLYVGTHALLSGKHNFELVIIDEQHRFGVEQRSRLLDQVKRPHLITMTATPIPRSLAMVIIDQLKVVNLPGRKKQVIETKLVENRDNKGMLSRIDSEVKAGRQGFIVVPRINGDLDSESLAAIRSWYQKRFPKLKFDIYHGQLNQEDQQKTARRFADGDIDILVATSIIEVGVNFPNASFIIIESAEMFGLAQLHQLRGRVGRGEKKGFCFVIGAQDSERLMKFTKLKSGFDLAEVDLKLRGPGNIIGFSQTGWPRLRFAELEDFASRNLAKRIVDGWQRLIPEGFQEWQLLMQLDEEGSDKIFD